MKKMELLRCGVAKLKTGLRLKNSTFAFLLLTGMGLSGCHERGCDDPEPIERCGTVDASACRTFATVEEDACHDGALGTKWLRLNNGDLLWPQRINMAAPTLEHGQRVQLGFTVLQANPTFTSHCQYFAIPEEPDLAIAITCIQPILFCGTGNGSAGCNTFATAENAMCGQGVWGGIWLKLDDGTWLQPFENAVAGATLEVGQRYKIGYEKMARDNRYDGQVNCMAMPPAAEAVRITCLTAEEPETTTSK